MEGFPGFPDGELESVRLPDQFFSELLPIIDDLFELKVTLHCLWLVQQKQGDVRYITASELLADEGLAPLSDGMTWERRLERGMGQAAALGARLAEAGLTVASMRVRAPTLASVVLRWTGEELEP